MAEHYRVGLLSARWRMVYAAYLHESREFKIEIEDLQLIFLKYSRNFRHSR